MLSIFPQLFDYIFLGPTILRLALGIAFMAAGIELFKERERGAYLFDSIGFHPGLLFARFVAVLKFTTGLLLFIGLFMQPAAMVIALISLVSIFARINRPDLIRSPFKYYAILLAVSLSLLVLGPGIWAFDLPL